MVWTDLSPASSFKAINSTSLSYISAPSDQHFLDKKRIFENKGPTVYVTRKIAVCNFGTEKLVKKTLFLIHIH